MMEKVYDWSMRKKEKGGIVAFCLVRELEIKKKVPVIYSVVRYGVSRKWF